MKKKMLISMLLVLVFLSLSVSPTFAANIQAAYAKIPDDLLDAFDEVGSNGTLDVVVWLEDNSTEEYQSIVSNIPEPDFETETADAASYGVQSVAETGAALSDEERAAQMEAMQNYIMQKRQIAQAVYLEDNTAIANELAESGGEIVYISKYSPLVICNVTLSEVVDMAMSSRVLSLENGNVECADTLLSSADLIGTNTMNTNNYTGQGVKIGMVESGNVDDSYALIANLMDKITIRTNYTNPTRHATIVAAIMINSTQGIARGFEHLYSAAAKTTGDLIPCTEWLLDNGVNVINYSWSIFGKLNGRYTTQYTSKSLWMEHIAYNHSVHCVAATGNIKEDIGNVVNQIAMANNVIGVGCIDDTKYPAEDTIWNNSVYNDTLFGAYKPDISAPGCKIDVPGITGEESTSGTSWAAPHVTGTIAVLCDYYPSLLTKQALMKSILLSSVNTNGHNYDTQICRQEDDSVRISDGYMKYGGGIVNAFNAKRLIDSRTFVNSSVTASENRDVISLGTIQQGETVSITLFFLERVRFTSSEDDHSSSSSLSESDADLDLYVCPVSLYIDGVCSRTSNHTKSITSNNVEKIIFTANATSEYIICIDKYADQNPYEILYAVSWYFE